MKGLLRRASTALIFVVVMLGGLYGGYYSFIILFAVITALCLWEFLEMTIDHGKRRDWLRRFLGTAFGLMPFLLAVLIHLKVIPMNDTFIIITALLFFPFIFMAFTFNL